MRVAALFMLAVLAGCTTAKGKFGLDPETNAVIMGEFDVTNVFWSREFSLSRGANGLEVHVGSKPDPMADMLNTLLAQVIAGRIDITPQPTPEPAPALPVPQPRPPVIGDQMLWRPTSLVEVY